MKQCTATGQVVPATFLTSWARECGTLTPQQAIRVRPQHLYTMYSISLRKPLYNINSTILSVLNALCVLSNPCSKLDASLIRTLKSGPMVALVNYSPRWAAPVAQMVEHSP